MVSGMVTFPPPTVYKGEPLKAESAEKAVREMKKKQGSLPVYFQFNYPDAAGPNYWTDGGRFSREDKLDWAAIWWSIDDKEQLRFGPPKTAKIWVIECKNEEEAKKHFLMCRLKRLPGYYYSGRFIIKASNSGFAWFLEHYGATGL